MLTKDINDNIRKIKEVLPIEKSFDLIDRRLKIGSKEGYLVFVDGFCKDEIMYYIINHLQEIDLELNSIDIINNELAYIEVDTFRDFEKLNKSVLSGNLALVVDGSDIGILIDVREYPTRSVQESEIEKITRGSKDCFVETIIFNTALIRRRLRDEKLIFEMLEVTTRAKTDVVVSYIDDKVDKELLNIILDKIKKIELESLVMNEKTLEECIFEKKWYNIFPQAKYTQRPDISASQLLEGNILIMVDTSPTVMILPTTLFSFTQYIEDFFETSLIGTYTRLLRMCALLVSLLLTPLWLLVAENNQYVLPIFEFILPSSTPKISYLMQFILITISFDILTLATLHAGSSISSTFGFIGGLLLGQLGISLGYFSEEAVFFSIITLISGHCVPNKELESSIKISRWIILISIGFFGIVGLFLSLFVLFLLAFTTKTLDRNKPYLWPIFPFDKKAFLKIIARTTIKSKGRKE